MAAPTGLGASAPYNALVQQAARRYLEETAKDSDAASKLSGQGVAAICATGKADGSHRWGRCRLASWPLHLNAGTQKGEHCSDGKSAHKRTNTHNHKNAQGWLWVSPTYLAVPTT